MVVAYGGAYPLLWISLKFYGYARVLVSLTLLFALHYELILFKRQKILFEGSTRFSRPFENGQNDESSNINFAFMEEGAFARGLKWILGRSDFSQPITYVFTICNGEKISTESYDKHEYWLRGLLGEGAFAACYKIQHVASNGIFAVKRFLKSRYDEPHIFELVSIF
jgi:hypothetical protein